MNKTPQEWIMHILYSDDTDNVKVNKLMVYKKADLAEVLTSILTKPTDHNTNLNIKQPIKEE